VFGVVRGDRDRDGLIAEDRERAVVNRNGRIVHGCDGDRDGRGVHAAEAIADGVREGVHAVPVGVWGVGHARVPVLQGLRSGSPRPSGRDDASVPEAHEPRLAQSLMIVRKAPGFRPVLFWRL